MRENLPSLLLQGVIPPAGEWTGETPAMLRDSMLRAIGGWDPALRGIVERTDPSLDHDRNFGGGALEQMG
ncbi:MAG: hypothetical protein ACRDND_19950 [Streptosporangiaceae bacterium]